MSKLSPVVAVHCPNGTLAYLLFRSLTILNHRSAADSWPLRGLYAARVAVTEAGSLRCTFWNPRSAFFCLCLASSPQFQTPTICETLSATPQLAMSGYTAPWSVQKMTQRLVGLATHSTLNTWEDLCPFSKGGASASCGQSLSSWTLGQTANQVGPLLQGLQPFFYGVEYHS